MSQVKTKKSEGKSKKTKTSTTESESVTTSTSAPVVLAPVAPTPTPIVVSAPVTLEPETVVTTESTLVEQEESNTEILFNKLVNQFQDIQSVMKTLHANLKLLQKEVLRERKESKKKESKSNKKKSDKKRSPSGFAKPAPISNDLSSFLNLENGIELARTEVTSKVIAYVKEHQLQNPENKKQILLDEKLKKLLTPEEGDVVTYFNLQTYLKKHFIGQTVTSVTVV